MSEKIVQFNEEIIKGLTKVSPEAMLAENLIRQNFRADKPRQKPLTDLTQVQCSDGKLFWTASTARSSRCAWTAT